MIIDGLTDHFTHSTADTDFFHHRQMQGRKIRLKGTCRTLRHTGMATLAGRAESLRNRRDPHSDVVNPLDRKERFRSTGGNARQVLTEQTGRLIGEENGSPILRMGRDRTRRTSRDTIIALRTTLKKEIVSDCTRRTQPVHTNWKRRRRCWKTIRLLDEFVRGSDGRNNGIFQEIPPTV